MKLSELIGDVNHQLNTQKPKYENGNPYLTLKVEPKDKALVAFLVIMASRRIDGHYSEINTGIKSDPFDYRLEGAADEVKLLFNYKAFRDGTTFQSHITQLLPAITTLIKEISLGWVPGRKSIFDGEENYENPHIAGTYYVFLLQQVAINLGIDVIRGYFLNSNAISFDTWLPCDGWCLADEITVKGNSALITRFIAALSEELQIINDFESKDKTTSHEAETKLSVSEGSVTMDLSNATIKGGIKISLTNGHKGITFIQELTEQNQRKTEVTRVHFDRESGELTFS